MDITKIFYVVGGLALVALFALNGVIARTVLPYKLLSDIQKRKWTPTEFAIVLAPGVMAAILGLVFLQVVFWTVLCGLSLAMLVSALMIWALGRRWPHLPLSRRIAWVLALYLVIAIGVTLPSVAGSDIRWTHLRGLLALIVLLLFLAVASAGALVGVGGATVYFAVASEIARLVFFAPPGPVIEPELVETPSETEPLPTRSDFEEPNSRSA
jgi:hypothetical protein